MYDHTQVVNSFVGTTHRKADNMSAILEEGIGFGGPASIAEDKEKQEKFAKDHPYDTAEANFPHKSEDPFRVDLSPPKYVTNLDVALKDASEIRNQSINNARVALEAAFSEKYKAMVSGSKNIVPQKSTNLQQVEEGVTEAEIDEIVKELEGECCDNTEDKEEVKVDKRHAETVQMIKTFREKVAKYPKHLSYEGSMVLCVMLALKEIAHPSLNNLPMVDQELIRALVPQKFLGDLDYFTVTFDDEKDFSMKFVCRNESEPYLMTMFNSVAHPRPEDLKDRGAGVVPVEKDGDRISIGGKILMNKKGVKRLIGVEPLKRDAKRQESDEDAIPRRQAVAGRNAYEIRADVLQMAIDWSTRNDEKTSDDDVVDLAKKFYQFVENKR